MELAPVQLWTSSWRLLLTLHIKINRVVFEWNIKNDVAAKWKFFDWPDLSKKSLIIQEKSKVCFSPAAFFAREHGQQHNRS